MHGFSDERQPVSNGWSVVAIAPCGPPGTAIASECFTPAREERDEGHPADRPRLATRRSQRDDELHGESRADDGRPGGHRAIRAHGARRAVDRGWREELHGG